MPMSNGECGIYRWLLNCDRIQTPVYGVLTELADIATESPVSLDQIVTGLANSIQTQQARGPYLLAGYSFGGVLAFEVARELSQRGGDVAYCGIVDSFLPFASRYRFEFRQLGPMVGNLWNWVPDFLNSGKCALEIRRWFSRRARPEGRLRNYLGLNQATQDLIARHLRAMDEHTLNPWPGRIWFYRARVRPLAHSHNIESLWHSATGAEILCREIPGNHVSILYPPQVDRLSQAMANDIGAVLNPLRPR
jgi:thioesterase domain-containing protein